jgi:hypothetical protein
MKNYTIDLTFDLGEFESPELAIKAFGELKVSEMADILYRNAEITEHELEG